MQKQPLRRSQHTSTLSMASQKKALKQQQMAGAPLLSRKKQLLREPRARAMPQPGMVRASASALHSAKLNFAQQQHNARVLQHARSKHAAAMRAPNPYAVDERKVAAQRLSKRRDTLIKACKTTNLSDTLIGEIKRSAELLTNAHIQRDAVKMLCTRLLKLVPGDMHLKLYDCVPEKHKETHQRISNELRDAVLRPRR
jgi:hypothetical protein